MATETDTWQVAWIIAEQFGREGVDWAARMAHSFQIGGKMDSYREWLSIMEKVDELTLQEGQSATAQ
jgi:hypothetical protein